MYFVDPDNSLTHVNHPAPHLPEHFVKTVTELGGLNPYGEPILRFVWGQERRWYWAGKERLYYVDTRIEPIEHTLHTRQRSTENGLEKKYYRTVDEALEDREVFGGFYVPETKREFIGECFWFLEQWKPAHMIADREEWEATRYGEFEDPDNGAFNDAGEYHGVIIQNCDLRGEYPARGRYEMVFKVAERTGDVDERGDPVERYRPIGEDVISRIRALIQAREVSPRFLDPAKLMREMIEKHEAEEEKIRAERRQKWADQLMPHAYRFIEGEVNPYALLTPQTKVGDTRNTRFGKAKVVKTA